MKNNSIREVAKRAGVSIATVSRVINQSANVDPMKVEAVKEAMEYYKYVPNQFGRGLVKQKTEMIGVYFSYSGRSLFDNTFYLELLRGIDKAVSGEKYSLLLINENSDDDEKKQPKYIEYIYQHRIDGILLNGMSEEMAKRGELIQLIEEGYPVVYIGKQIHELGMNVYAQYEVYMKQMIEKFYKNGHRSILVFLEDKKRNLHLFEKICVQCRKEYGDIQIQTVAVGTKGQKEVIQNRLKEFIFRNHGSAVFTYDMDCAFAVINFCGQNGIKIPADISLISVEHKMNYGADLYPQVSSFYVPAKEMGYQAGKMLIECLKNGEYCGLSVKFETVYKERGSLGAARTVLNKYKN